MNAGETEDVVHHVPQYVYVYSTLLSVGTVSWWLQWKLQVHLISLEVVKDNSRFYSSHCFPKHAWRPAKDWAYLKAEKEEESLSTCVYAICQDCVFKNAGFTLTGKIWPLWQQAQTHILDSYVIYLNIWMRPETNLKLSICFFLYFLPLTRWLVVLVQIKSLSSSCLNNKSNQISFSEMFQYILF